MRIGNNMAIINKITKYTPATASDGQSVHDEQSIQSHLDEQNQLGYYLIGVEEIGGWYHFFWAKEV